jgi:hypothetical protein
MKSLMKLIKTQRFGNGLCTRPQEIIIKISKNGGTPTQLGPLERASLNARSLLNSRNVF